MAIADQFVTAPTMAEIERGAVAEDRSDWLEGEIRRRWFQDHVLLAVATECSHSTYPPRESWLPTESPNTLHTPTRS